MKLNELEKNKKSRYLFFFSRDEEITDSEVNDIDSLIEQSFNEDNIASKIENKQNN